MTHPLLANGAGPLVYVDSEEYAAVCRRIVVWSGIGCGHVVYDRRRRVIYVSFRISGSVVVVTVEIGAMIMVVAVIAFVVAVIIVGHTR
jgi:hypothetical protein